MHVLSCTFTWLYIRSETIQYYLCIEIKLLNSLSREYFIILLPDVKETQYYVFADKHYPTQGNWTHIRYATRAEKERALSLSGRQILPGVMVGVVECKEPPMIGANPGLASPERSVQTILW